MQVTPVQVYQEVLAQGGDQVQAQVAAALVSGVESDGDPTELSGGKGPAAGLFQYEPSTWIGQGGGKYAPVAQDASWQDQVAVFVNGTRGDNFGAWGPDIVANSGNPNDPNNPAYGYTGAPQPGSVVGNIIAQDYSTWGAAAPADLSGGGGGGTTNGAAAAATNPVADNVTATVDGQSFTFTGSNAASEASALAQMSATLGSYGFSGPDLTTLTNWAWQEITNNTDPAQVVLDLQTPGSAVYPIFQKQFPGFTSANEELISQGLPAVSVSQYQQYETNAFAAAQAAGLPPGFLNKDNIGVLIGGNVSSTELTSRLNDAVALAYQSTPEQQSMFNQYFGVADNNPYLGVNLSGHGPLTTGQIAALALDPKTAEPLIHQQITAAQLGGTGVTVGLGAISEPEAMKLAQSGVSGTQSFASFAPLAPLETALPGQGGDVKQQVIGPDTLVEANLLGTGADVRAQQVAQETRKAPFEGGGGYVQNAKGAVGTGSASGTGSGQ